MKIIKLIKKTSVIISIIIAIVVFASCSDNSKLEKKLNRIKNVEYTEIESDSIYSESYELWFTQHVDHQNPKSLTFKQKVIVSHVGFDRPTVVILEGYELNSTKAGELSKLLNANQITIEHRFYADSRPDSIPWEHLTIKQAATDQHKIINSLKKLYPEKWLSTGISKGGQTTMYHRRFYPDDVDASVTYVAPLNLGREDSRIANHLKTVGAKECRDKILGFQLYLFENKSELMPLVEQYAQENDITFSEIGIDRAYDLNVLEYNFAFWQWNGNCDVIPTADASIKENFDHWFEISSISWFGDQKNTTELLFSYQALSEIGFYEYDITPFTKYLDDTVNITFDFRIPNYIEYSYNPESMKDINGWLQEYGNNILYIYGEYDPWGATTVAASEKTNAIVMINPKGNHRTRIKSFPGEMKEEIYLCLEDWMDVQIKRDYKGLGSSEMLFEIL